MKHIAITKQVLDGVEVNSVSGRELYENLGFDKSQFSRWSKKNITDNGFATEGHDYIVIDIMSNGKEVKDYIVSIDFANKLAMMARTQEGEKLRNYFVKVEKQLRKEAEPKNNAVLEMADIKHKLQCMFEYNDKMGEVVTEHEKKLIDHDSKIENLQKNRRLESWMEKNLLDAKMTRVYQLANNDEKLAKKLHSRIWRAFKNKFHISSYRDLSVGRYEDGLMWLNNVQLHEVV